MRTPPNRLILLLTRPLDVAVLVALPLMVVHILGNAVLRYVFAQPITGTLEIVTYWYMPIIVLAGFVAAEARGQHLDAPLLTQKLSRPAQVGVEVAVVALCLVMCLGFAYFSAGDALENAAIGLTSGAIGVPIWQPMLLVPLAYVAMSLSMVAKLVSLIRGDVEFLEAEEPSEEALWDGDLVVKAP